MRLLRWLGGLFGAAAAVAEKYDVGGDGFGSRDWIFALSAR